MNAATPDVTGRRIAAIVASLAAGPTFALLVLPGPASLAEVPEWVASWLLVIGIFSMAGVAIAITPVAMGVYLGGWLGTRDRRWRNPLVWAAIGAALGATLVWWVTDTIMPAPRPWPSIATGFVIALVARRFIGWTR